MDKCPTCYKDFSPHKWPIQRADVRKLYTLVRLKPERVLIPQKPWTFGAHKALPMMEGLK